MDDKQQLRDLRAAVEAVIEDDHEGSEMLAILIVDRVVGPLVADRDRALAALGEYGRNAVAVSGDLEDGVNAEHLLTTAERDGLLAALAAAEADRDRARDAAVALEQENARTRHLHRPTVKTCDDDENTEVTVCMECDGLRELWNDEAEPAFYPCDTIRALKGEDD